MTAQHSTSITERLMWIGNTLFHQCIGVITAYLFWTYFYYFNTSSQFTWHVILSTLAYIPLMAEAIVLFATDNVWSQNISRSFKYYIHGMLLFVSAIVVTVGNALMIDLKAANHFVSTHAWTGLVSWIFVLLSQFLGLAVLKPQVFKMIPAVFLKVTHNLFGLLGYIFGIVSLGYAIIDKQTLTGFTVYDSRVGITVVMAIAVVWSILAALKSGYNQIKTIITR